MRNKNRLYNVAFPVWLLIIFPVSWLLIIPANFIIDSLVLLLSLWILKIDRKKEFYKRTILWIFLFGFVSDLIGSGFLLLSQFIFKDGRGYEFIGGPVAENPFDNIYSLLYVALAVVISGVLIYVFNRFISFRIVLDKRIKRITALILAILTTPYMFLIPTSTFYGGRSESFTNHFVPDEYIELELYAEADGKKRDITKDENGKQKNYILSTALADGINTAKKTKKSFSDQPLYNAVFAPNRTGTDRLDTIPIWREGDVLYFKWKDRYYEIGGEYCQRILEEIEAITTDSIIVFNNMLHGHILRGVFRK